MKQPQPLMEISVRFPLHAWEGLLKDSARIASIIAPDSDTPTYPELRARLAVLSDYAARDMINAARGIQASLRVIQGAEVISSVRGAKR